MGKKKKIHVGTISLKLRDVSKPRYLPLLGGFGVHDLKTRPKRAKRKQELRKEIDLYR